MKIDTSKLITINTYSKEKGQTTQATYAQIERGEVEVVIIDGKKFIKKK